MFIIDWLQNGLSHSIAIWIAAILTIFIYSFLYKDNPFYKFAEHLLVGVSAGYFFIMYLSNNVIPNLAMPLIDGFGQLFGHGRFTINLLPIIPGVLGILIITRFIPKIGWLSKWPIGFYVGAYAGLTIPAYMQAQVLTQVYGTFVSGKGANIAPIFSFANIGGFFNAPGWGTFIGAISGPLMIVGVIATLTYFFFSLEHRGFVGGVAKVGIVFLMIGFGASFGYTVMARVSLLIGRVQFLLTEWLGLIS
jgi:hypothetical protein